MEMSKKVAVMVVASKSDGTGKERLALRPGGNSVAQFYVRIIRERMLGRRSRICGICCSNNNNRPFHLEHAFPGIRHGVPAR